MEGRKTKRLTTAVLATSLVAVAAAGCSSKKEGTGTAASPSPTAGTPAEVSYPASISYWVSLNPNAAATMKSYNEIAAYKELEKKTGTKVDFQHPPAGQEKDQFNLMIASSKLPDVIEYDWSGAPKGADSLVKEKRIIRLNELIEKYAPNLTKVLKDNPEFRKMITTDEGNIYAMPFLLGDPQLSSVNGPILRKDWLDKVGMQAPKTIADWEAVLTAFRDKDPNGNGKKDELPFVYMSSETDFNHLFIGAWGITQDFFQENGKVKYGPLEPQYKEYLTTMAKWYKEGLIDKDYATTDGKLKDAKVTGNQAGSFSGYAGSGIGRYIGLVQPKDPSFSLMGVPYPVLKEGDKALGQYTYPFTGIGAAITSSAKNPEQIVKWLDYKYGQEGHLLFNFGIEGQSYKMENGYPKYTDTILNNPDKLPVTQAMAKYFIASWSGPIVQDKRYIEQYFALPEQQNAQKAWMTADHSKLMPPVTLTAEESSKVASIMNDVKTYRDEMISKFIMGAEPMANYDKFVQTLKSMGIEEAIKARQAALDRFNSRK
ncbi:extracellular solute-binding protein [Paenibacillus aurantius]|uniref:Extracellular solute-binding protein n=1 Tax=Paenibacillus aurantius TaxID=2918900 RepID=A0AA96RCT9_9BACL|nr:extracellular solute-binding protein [Paenibacillus aurantius]WNQ09057.1 extracellular solute-binding protein [Paenibacillus aurantius]